MIVEAMWSQSRGSLTPRAAVEDECIGVVVAESTADTAPRLSSPTQRNVLEEGLLDPDERTG